MMRKILFLLSAGIICLIFSSGCMSDEMGISKGLSPEKASFESEVFHYDDYIRFVYSPDILIPSTYFVTYSADVNGDTLHAESDRKYDGIFRDKPLEFTIPLDNRTSETVRFKIAIVDHWGRTVEESELTINENDTVSENGPVSVSDLLSSPDYGGYVRVFGQVSGLNDSSDYFSLTSEGSIMKAFYRNMVRETGTRMPDADISTLMEGDSVIISGEMQKGGNFSRKNDFWIYEIS